jgi:hypothetical protein
MTSNGVRDENLFLKPNSVKKPISPLKQSTAPTPEVGFLELDAVASSVLSTPERFRTLRILTHQGEKSKSFYLK